MDSWSEHLLWHLIGFLVFTLPVCFLLITFVAGDPFTLRTFVSVFGGALFTVLVLGLVKFGLPR